MAESNFLQFLKKSEPIGVLASLSLVVATFTFEEGQFGSIYNYSVTSSFMFLTSFVFSIFYQWLPSNFMKQYPSAGILNKLLQFGTYFFLSLGIILMLFVMIEFGKLQSQIFAILGSFIALFLGYLVIVVVIRELKNRLIKKTPMQISLINAISYFMITFFSVIAIGNIVEALFNLSGIRKYLVMLDIYLIGPVAMVIFISYLIKITVCDLNKRRRLLQEQATSLVSNEQIPKKITRSSRAFIIIVVVNCIVIVAFSSILTYLFLSPEFYQNISQLTNPAISQNSNITSDSKNRNTQSPNNSETHNDSLPNSSNNVFSRFI